MNQKTLATSLLRGLATSALVISLAGCSFLNDVASRLTPTEAPATPPTAKVAPESTPKPTRAPEPTRKPSEGKRVVRGTASTYGPGYDGLFALPTRLGGRGERVRICSIATGRCVVRTSNDVGPVARLNRVADLDVPTFEYLCRCKWTIGLQKVKITFL